MLVLEVAAGVLLGLLAYRGLVSFSTNRNITLPAAIFLVLLRFLGVALSLGFVAVLLFGIYLYLTHSEYLRQHRSGLFWALILLGISLSVWSDIDDRTRKQILKGE